jgi:hypothetical protein
MPRENHVVSPMDRCMGKSLAPGWTGEASGRAGSGRAESGGLGGGLGGWCCTMWWTALLGCMCEGCGPTWPLCGGAAWPWPWGERPGSGGCWAWGWGRWGRLDSRSWICWKLRFSVLSPGIWRMELQHTSNLLTTINLWI